MWMSLKTAVVGVPFGVEKAECSRSKALNEQQLEELSREYARRVFDIIGFDKDVPAPDVNTNPKIIDWMTDEFIKQSKKVKTKSPKLTTLCHFYWKS